MPVENKRIAKNTLVLYIRMFLLMIVSLYSSRIILSALGVEDYGIYQVVGGFVALFQVVSNAISSAITRFITVELGHNNIDRLKRVFSSSIVILLLLSVFFFIFVETFGLWYVNNKMVLPSTRLFAANWVLQFSALSFAVGLVSLPYNALIIAHEKLSTYAFIGIFEAISKLLICFIVGGISKMDRLIFYSALLMSLSIVVRIISQLYCRKQFVESKVRLTFDRELFGKMFSFSGWTFIGSGAAVLRTQGVNIVLNLFFGPVVNAARGIASQVNGAVTGFCSNFIIAINPQIMKQYAAGNRNESFSLVMRGARFSTFLSFFVALPIVLEAPFILDIWLTEVPNYTIDFVRLIIIYAMIESISNTMATLLMANGEIKYYQIIVGGIQLLNLPLSYLVLKLGFKPYFTVLVAIALAVVSMMARLLILRHQVRFPVMRYLREVILVILVVIAVGAFGPVLLWKTLDMGWARFFIVGFASVLSVGFTVLFIGCNRHERSVIVSSVKKILRIK